MAVSQEQDLQLKEWLVKTGFQDYYDKLRECGVNSLDDLRILETEDEVKELAGSSGIGMGVVFRRKFINCVMGLKSSGGGGGSSASPQPAAGGLSPPSNAPVGGFQGVIEAPDDSPSAGGGGSGGGLGAAGAATEPESPAKRKSVQMSGTEDQALQRLRGTIRQHTQSIKLLKENVPLVRDQAIRARQYVQEYFDECMREFAKRKKFLDDNINLAESETTANLQKKLQALQDSARGLLTAKKTVETELAKEVDDQEKRERAAHVVTTVTEVLQAAPKEETAMYTLLVDNQGQDLKEAVNSWGQVTVTRKKQPSQEQSPQEQ